ncbi:hypothetical protein Q7C36_015505 [Tachysurus vachellii]|uniref:Uncharacterized protein n=1 Tax=Tachysurus vachellii TaxID=175792 RepID=A0AA88ME84_TACVA|nr:hypothetical protein Q7C36_015505 [Tachysurus vachellii]
MAGGPQNFKQISEPRTINIDVREGGVHTGAILEGNEFRGQVISRTSYTGPPTREGEGSGPVMPREQNDRTISIRNDGSQSHQNIVHNNAFGGDVVVEHNINIQPVGQNNENIDEGRIDLR